jgi:hypothetical protein
MTATSAWSSSAPPDRLAGKRDVPRVANVDNTLTCVIPGHELPGEEIIAEELRGDTGDLRFEYSGYAANFEYSS